MSSIAVTASATGTGVVSLVAPVTNTNRTINLPDSNGTVLTTVTAGVPVNGPAFSVSSTALVSAAASTFTKITYDTEDFDTNSNFASSRFTPTVAGYYQLNATISYSANTATGISIVTFYKNGSRFLDGSLSILNATNTTFANASGIIYFNGSTDYVEVYGFQTTVSAMNIGSAASTVKFTGAMVRSAT
jgi:hypothetical protein